MKVVEIQESNIKSEDKYQSNSYPKSGLYLNTDENNYTELMDVNRYTSMVNFLYINNLDHIPDYKPKEVKSIEDAKIGMVSERTALKMLQIALHGEKAGIKDI